MRALTYWPEWCPAFPGVRLRDGTPSPLDKPVENRPMAPWAIIAPTMHGPGRWIAMHAGKHIGGRAGNDGALGDVIATAKAAGWTASVAAGDRIRLAKDGRAIAIRPDDVVTSAIVAIFRVTRALPPGDWTPFADLRRAWRFTDRWGWCVDVNPLDTPVPCRGAQGLWAVPDDVEEAVLRGLDAPMAAQVRSQWGGR